MISAFERAVRQLGDPRLRGVIWWSLALSLVLQIGIAGLAWWGLRSFATFEMKWINEAIRWLGGGAVIVLALMLFPASFGIVISIFLEQIADIVESEHYPISAARGIPIWTGIWTGIVFLLAVIALNLVMLPFYILSIFIAGLGAVLLRYQRLADRPCLLRAGGTAPPHPTEVGHGAATTRACCGSPASSSSSWAPSRFST